jgi:hypothetical protein
MQVDGAPPPLPGVDLLAEELISGWVDEVRAHFERTVDRGMQAGLRSELLCPALGKPGSVQALAWPGLKAEQWEAHGSDGESVAASVIDLMKALHQAAELFSGGSRLSCWSARHIETPHMAESGLRSASRPKLWITFGSAIADAIKLYSEALVTSCGPLPPTVPELVVADLPAGVHLTRKAATHDAAAPAFMFEQGCAGACCTASPRCVWWADTTSAEA